MSNDATIPVLGKRSTSAEPLRVGIIGAGLMGYWHADAARRLGARIVRVADPDLSRAQALAHRLPGAIATSASDSVLQRDLIDAVHICSPLQTHSRLARSAVDAGIHALVEKPMVSSAREARMLMEAARRANIIICPVHQICFQDGVRRARAAIRELGAVSKVDFNICSAGGGRHPVPALNDIVADILPHPLSVLQAIWPDMPLEPSRWSVPHSRPGELLVTGEHAGALLTLFVSMHARPTCFDMTVQCRDGTIRLDLFHGFAFVRQSSVSRFQKAARPFADAAHSFVAAATNLGRRSLRREPAYPGLRNLIRLFYGAVRTEHPSPIPADNVLAVAEGCEAIWARAESGIQVTSKNTAASDSGKVPQEATHPTRAPFTRHVCPG